jgi:nitrite reductase (NADH) small subunit
MANLVWQTFTSNRSGCIKYKDKQIATEERNEWYACQNVCPHKMVLSKE